MDKPKDNNLNNENNNEFNSADRWAGQGLQTYSRSVIDEAQKVLDYIKTTGGTSGGYFGDHEDF